MNKFFTFKRCTSAVSLLAVTAISQNIMASGYGVRELSVFEQGSAYAGASSSTDSVSHMYTNPATLIDQIGTQGTGGAFAIFPHTTVNHTTATFPFTADGLTFVLPTNNGAAREEKLPNMH